jgi:nucleoside-diphosphate kinase
MIKPDAVTDGFSGPIIQQIEDAGFRIVAIKKTKLSPEDAGRFYAVHAERPFFQSLCDYMSSSHIIPMVLEKENAVEEFRTLIGSTNPAQAAEGTIRKRFARSIESNAIHGSDSDENAAIESNFFFTEQELNG